MLDKLFDTTITVRRRNTTTRNSLGELNYGDMSTWTATYTNIKARIEKPQNNDSQDYNPSGQRENTGLKIYVEKDKTIELQDAIYSNSVFIGLVIGVFKAYAPNNNISHYEIAIELK
jgi:hypothetical protein